MFTAGFLSHILIISISQIKTYNTSDVAMNLLPVLANLVFCWMLCCWVIAQGPHQRSLKAGLLLIIYWPLDWPPSKANLWRQHLWFVKTYQEEVLASYLLAEDRSSCVSFLLTPLSSLTPSSTQESRQYAKMQLLKLGFHTLSASAGWYVMCLF